VTIKAIYHFTVGLIGGMFGDKAPNTMIANSSIAFYNHIWAAHNASIYMQSLDITNKTTYEANYPLYRWYEEQMYRNLSNSAEDFENILGSVHPIVHGCYSSVYEFGNVTM
jgi:hypothetical protein